MYLHSPRLCMFFLAWSSKKGFWTNAIRVNAQGQLKTPETSKKKKKISPALQQPISLNLSCMFSAVCLPCSTWSGMISLQTPSQSLYYAWFVQPQHSAVYRDVVVDHVPRC